MQRILQSIAVSLSILSSAAAAPAGIDTGVGLSQRAAAANCRCFPGDACWPSQADWAAFNKTLGGKLIATKPIAASCHVDQFEPFDAAKCANLQATWTMPETHFGSSSSIMAPFFANQSCDPFTPKAAQCVIGTYNQYAVNAKTAADYQATIAFAQKRNIRLTIRNTGHDYYGRSTGAGALSIWTHNLKDIKFIDYQSYTYTGKAVKMGAGVQVQDLNKAAHDAGFTAISGQCPTVGVAGGYTQGAGHGPLASKFGLAADQVLEWEVVTGAGEYLIATPTKNSDLYWALSGGGGGTYAVVLSLTSKVYPAIRTAAANLTFTNDGVSQDTFFQAIQKYITYLPALNDAGAVSIWLISTSSFSLTPTTAPGLTKAQLQKLYDPFLADLTKLNITHNFYVNDFPTYLDSYNAMNPPNPVAVFQLGGRLIPRSLANDARLTTALRNIVEKGALISGVSVNVPKKPGTPANAVNPNWRTTLFSATLGTFWSNDDWNSNLANQKLMTDVLVPELSNLTPGGGAYLNEADFRQPDYQDVFYGGNYNQLKAIKDKYDPQHTFYGITGVGSDYWAQQPDGRLCKA